MQLLDLFGNQKILKESRFSITDLFSDFINSFSKTETFDITVPKHIYTRTLLIIEYIEDEENVVFDLNDFLGLIYMDFINNAIKHYNPTRIYRDITMSYQYDEKLLIHKNGRVFEADKRSTVRTIVTMNMEKRNCEKGRLLLEEMEDIYGQAPDLSKMISTLWINFIEKYKSGQEEETLGRILTLLEDLYEEEYEEEYENE